MATKRGNSRRLQRVSPLLALALAGVIPAAAMALPIKHAHNSHGHDGDRGESQVYTAARTGGASQAAVSPSVIFYGDPVVAPEPPTFALAGLIVVPAALALFLWNRRRSDSSRRASA
jgi:hypothetical protein